MTNLHDDEKSQVGFEPATSGDITRTTSFFSLDPQAPSSLVEFHTSPPEIEYMHPQLPACKKEYDKAKKTWKYGQFKVYAYACECGTDFREYTRNDKHSFTLKKTKDGRWRKAR